VLVSGSPLLETLKIRDYRRYMTGNALSHVGTWVQRVAVGWLAWELTHSGTWLGIIAFADLAPVVLIGPLGGAVSDRTSPLRIAIICQLICFVTSVLLCGITLLGAMTAPLLAVLVLAQGLAMGFVQPARHTLIYALVPRAHLPTAVALNAVIFNIARFTGPAVAGVILVWSGPAPAFALNAVSFLVFVVALYGLKVTFERPERNQDSPSIFDEIIAGASYVARHPSIGPLIAFAALVSFLVRPYMELLPGFADVVLGGGARELALLTSTTALGAIVAGIWLATQAGALTSFRFVVSCALTTAVAVAGFAASHSLVLSMLCVFVAGGTLVMVGITGQTLVQLNVDPQYRGRVLSFHGMLFRSGPATGALIMGIASEWFGLQWPVAVGAILVVLLGSGFRRRAARLDLRATARGRAIR